jgi:D-alanyl-D-alanine carboxypeptidase (penicillin-binding protein 5/6)
VATTLSIEERKGLKAVVKIPETVKAPIEKGQKVGTLAVTAPGVAEIDVPLVAAASVERLGFFPRIAMAANYMLGGKPELPNVPADDAEDKPAQPKGPTKPPPASAARPAAPPPPSAARPNG